MGSTPEDTSSKSALADEALCPLVLNLEEVKLI